MKYLCLLFVLCVVGVFPLRADLRVEVGNHVVPSGSNQFQVPIQVTGGDRVTDMVGAIQIGDGGPLVGGEPGPRIRSIGYDGSIWTGAAGGFDADATISLPAQLFDPIVSLRVRGQQVTGQGRLLMLALDLTGVTPGIYELRLAGVQGSSTSFQNTGTNVPVTIVNGWIAVGTTMPTILPRLTVTPLSAGRARLSFPSEVGRRYRVQWKGSLDGDWSEPRNDLAGTGGEVDWVDDGSAIGSVPGLQPWRFYRLRVVR